MPVNNRKSVLHIRNLHLVTENGRVLIDDLSMELEKGDQVAIVGHNGVGKSVLLETIVGHRAPAKGKVCRYGTFAFVKQSLDGNDGFEGSLGERRERELSCALQRTVDCLILDEPSQDLDGLRMQWFLRALKAETRGLIVVSHDERVLQEFEHFFLLSESGGRYFSGTYSELKMMLSKERRSNGLRYIRGLSHLAHKEQKTLRDARRRHRKKLGGRMREIDRSPSRALLNSKRSYAQESQGKRRKRLEERLAKARTLAKGNRRILAVSLPVVTELRSLPPPEPGACICVKRASVHLGERRILGPIDFQMQRERVAVTGANGAGKTTLLRLMLGEIAPSEGVVQTDRRRIGAISQGAENWKGKESLLDVLMNQGALILEEAMESVVMHEFPLALAERPLFSLSSGERLRAAMLCILKNENIDVLVLDEPACSLDDNGIVGLSNVLSAWEGGIVVASHNICFLETIGMNRELHLKNGASKYCESLHTIRKCC